MSNLMNKEPRLKQAICPLRETSIGGEPKVPMTTATIPVVNFDKVKEEYVKNMSLSECPKSSDAFYARHDEEMYLIEFKSGVIEDGKSHDIRRKMLDSLLLLTDIINKTISNTRKELTYILVYDESKNPASVKIAETLSGWGGKKFVRFGLNRFETIYFKEVFTVTKEKFEGQFVQVWSSS